MEKSYLNKEYSKIKKDFNSEYSILYEYLKKNNMTLSKSYKKVYTCFMQCLNYDKDRQILIEEHCTIDSISLCEHEKYHNNKELFIDAILIFLSNFKTFLNEITIYFSKIYMNKNNLRFKSFHSFYESIKKSEYNDEILNKILNFSKIIENALFFRDKYIEHPKELYSFDVSSYPFNGAVLIPNTNEENDRKELTFNDEVRISKYDKSKLLHVNTIGSKQISDGLIYYYHVKHCEKFGKSSNLIYQLPKSVLKGEPLFEVFDETNIHFLEYGPHTHEFYDTELTILSNKMHDEQGTGDIKRDYYKSQKEKKINLVNYFDIMSSLNHFVTSIFID